MNAAALLELYARQSKRERAKKGRAAGGDATPDQKAKRLGANVVPKRSDRSNKSIAKAAKGARVSERKVALAAKLAA